MNRMVMAGVLRLIDKRMPAVMNAVFLLLDQHKPVMKKRIQSEAFDLLKRMANDLDDAYAEGMIPKEFAAYLVFDSIKCLLLTETIVEEKGLPAENKDAITRDGLNWIKVLLDMGLMDQSMVKPAIDEMIRPHRV